MLAELELVVIEGDDPLAVTVPPVAERTALERSPAFRAYARARLRGAGCRTWRRCAAAPPSHRARTRAVAA